MNLMKWQWNKLFILVLMSGILGSNCQKQRRITGEENRILSVTPTVLKTVEHGQLASAGEGDDRIDVLTIWGSSYEMGFAHGTLLREQIAKHLPNLIRLMTEKVGVPVSFLDEVYRQSKPFIPARFLDEMRGIADGSGLEVQDVIRANLIGEASEWHCSLFGAWGKATAADGHLYQLRCLDYETGADIQRYPVLVIYVPEEGHVFANITWAGIVGCISGINEERLAISEIGDDYDREHDTFAGTPFMFLLRDVLQFDSSLKEAIQRIRNTPRTTSLIYGIGDGELGELRGLQTSHTLCNVFSPDNLEPVTPTHQRIPDIVYWGMSWNVPAYDGPLHDKLLQYYGRINAQNTINDIITSVGTGNLQAVVYDLTEMRIWLANARADHESGPLEAYNRTFLTFNVNALFQTAESHRK